MKVGEKEREKKEMLQLPLAAAVSGKRLGGVGKDPTTFDWFYYRSFMERSRGVASGVYVCVGED